VRSDDALFGLLRLAALHLEAADHTRVIELVAMWRGFPAAIARVASSDIGVRRAAVERRSTEAAGPLLRRQHGEGLFDRPRAPEPAAPGPAAQQPVAQQA
jgi:hypothetical protein